MKKIISIMMMFIVAVFIIAIVGCTPQISCDAPSKVIGNKCCADNNDNGVCDSEDVAEPEPDAEVVVEPEAEVTPEELVQEPEPVVDDAEEKLYQEQLAKLSATDRQRSNSIRKLVQSAMVSEENYFYRYSGPKRQQIEFWVKGDKMKVQILEPDKIDKINRYNMVFLDRAKGTAQGYCEPAGKGICWEGHGPFSETAEANIKMTPKDWLLKLGDKPYFASQNNINGVVYYIVDYPTSEGLYRVTLGNWKGWPREVELYKTKKPAQGVKSDDRWLYEHMELGIVMDENLMPNSALATRPNK